MQKNEKERLRQWAERHGLRATDTESGLVFDGELDAITIVGEADVTEHREVDELRRIHVHHDLTVTLAAKPAVDVADLQVTPEGIRAKMSKLFGGQDIQLGDPEFDPEFLIRGRAPAVEKVLGPITRRALLTAHAAKHEVCIDGGRVVLRDDDATRDANLDEGLGHLVKVAKSLGT